MSITERKLRVKFKNSIGDKLYELLGTNEVYFKTQESNQLYKKLSKSDDIEDWDWDEEEDKSTIEEPEINYSINLNDTIVEPKKSSPIIYKSISEICMSKGIKTPLDLAKLVKAIWKVSLNITDEEKSLLYTLISIEYENINDTNSFDFMTASLYIETKYKGVDLCIKYIDSKLQEKFDSIKTKTTFLAAFSELFK